MYLEICLVKLNDLAIYGNCCQKSIDEVHEMQGSYMTL